MTLVVDASIAVKWVVTEAGTEQARALIGRDTLVAPDLLIAEACNALWRLQASGRIPREQAVAAPAELVAAIDEFYPLAPLAGRSLEIALDIGHPVYDCVYLALAERLEARLVTADRRLAAAVAGMPLRRVVEVLS